MTDDEVKKLLLAIRAIAAIPYPFPDGSTVAPERAMALGSILGVADRALLEPPLFPVGMDRRE